MKVSNFPEEVLVEADSLKITETLLHRRNQVDGITIDDSSSLDLDDAIHVERKEDGYLVQVSIADVSEYVLPGSLLFEEALKRVATNYLRDYNIPMLPASISQNALSLLEQELRPAITFSIILDRELEIIKVEIYKTALRSRRRFNYAQADYIIDSCPDDPDYQLLNDCYIIARRLLDGRKKRGALAIYDLQNLLFTNEEGQLIRMKAEDAHKSNIIVQEFMILANMAVAELAAASGYIFLFRNHTTRQTTPHREEILEQLKTASANPLLYLETLTRRSSLWFNRAKYEPTLKGHYGLNLPAYTHITSPLRRITDLINQGLLKAQLFGTAPAFTFDELLKVSSEINSYLLNSAKEKSKSFKEKTRLQTRNQIEITASEVLIKMNGNDFKRILKEACRSKIMTPELEESLLERIAGQKLGVEHLALILFEISENNKAWNEVRNKAIEAALNTTGFSTQLLYSQAQIGSLTDFQIEVKEHKNGYAARVVARLDKNKKSASFYSTGSSKKEAQNAAANEFLRNYLSNTLVPEDMTEEPAETNNFNEELMNVKTNESSSEIIEENYVGQLGELCINRKSRSMPDYEFTQAGPSHAPTITCTCTLKINDSLLQTAGSSSAKKIAKQIAAKNMLDEMLKYSIEELVEKGIYNMEKNTDEIIEENFIGLLNDACLKSNYSIPQFQFSVAGPAHQPTFTCKVSIKSAKGTLSAVGAASNKKNAKQIAARELLKQIE